MMSLDRPLERPLGLRLILAILFLAVSAVPVGAQTPLSSREVFGGGYGVPGDFVNTVIDLSNANGVVEEKRRR